MRRKSMGERASGGEGRRLPQYEAAAGGFSGTKEAYAGDRAACGILGVGKAEVG